MPNPIIVYRVEHETKLFGPLCTEGSEFLNLEWCEVAKHHDSIDTYPECMDYLGGEIPENFKFGMASEELLLNLFREGMSQNIQDRGFVIRKYETEDYTTAPDGQVCYNSETAKEYHG